MRRCSCCGETKSIDHFQRNGYTKAGNPSWRSKCRECEGVKKAEKALTTVIDGKLYRQCIQCNEWKELNEDNYERIGAQGYLRHKCRLCRRTYFKQASDSLKQNDLVMAKCKQMATSARSRVLDDSRSYKKAYRNLVNPFGFSDSGELCQYLYSNFYDDINRLLGGGKIPSLDRKDSSIGYCPGNLQILEFAENTLKGVQATQRPVQVTYDDGSMYEYCSIAECARNIGVSATTIRYYIRTGHKKMAMSFKYVGGIQ